MMDFQSLINEKKRGLKTCTTIFTDTSGRKFEIQDGEKREIEKGLPFVVDTKPDLQVAKIIPGLFLSSQDPALSLEVLREHSIKNILSVGIEVPVHFEGIRYHFVELLDLPESEIFESVKTCLEIIHKFRSENILVHCNAGISRSPTIVISYLMALEKIRFEEAFQKVKSVREKVKPNEGFLRQLKIFEERLTELSAILQVL